MAKLVEQTYGEALFQTAMEANQVDAFLEEVELIQTVPVSYTHLTLPTNREV